MLSLKSERTGSWRNPQTIRPTNFDGTLRRTLVATIRANGVNVVVSRTLKST